MTRHDYPDRIKLAEGLAAGVAAVLAGGIATRGNALLAISGGSTPALFFEHLSNADIDWRVVTVTLVDERCVPADNDRSNAGLVGRTLLRNHAMQARFLPLFDATAVDALASARKSMALAPEPDAVVLGMGGDGHTASFFPGGDHLAEALDTNSPHRVESMRAPGAGEPRLTLTLHYLLTARFLALHIEGDEKRAVLDQALADGPVVELPVRAVLRGAANRLNVFWAP